MYAKLQITANFLKEELKYIPEIAIVLGSGLGDLVNSIEEKQEISYEDIPNFPVSTVEGHEGKLVVGILNGVKILAMKGRFHFYEGYAMKDVVYPFYIMKELGIKKLIVSNAAGGVNRDFTPGDLMIIEDHLNLMGTNPLIGSNDKRFGTRFPDLSEPYKEYLIDIAKTVADENELKYQKGVYAAVTGPSYETAAEIRYLERIGADAVGMSTVPEVITANYLGIDVLGISCITNMATGIATQRHAHDEVVKIANMASKNFCNWVKEIVAKI